MHPTAVSHGNTSQTRRAFLSTLGIAPVIGVALPLLPGCQWSADNSRSDARVKVVATTGMIADLVRQIGGELVHVTQLINAGVDPHLYKPIRDDVVAIMASEIVFYNGLKLEGRMADLLEIQPDDGRVHVALASEVPRGELLGEPGTDAIDPHIWMDVSIWLRASQAIERTLAWKIPSASAEFTARGNELRERLRRLDERGKTSIATIPQPQRVLISSHDAFQYFGRRYGLRVEGVQGISTASEASLSRIPELIDLILSGPIPAVFKESSVAGKLIDAIIEGAAARGFTLRIGEELYSDALGPNGSGAETYEGMVLHNFKSVTEALGGKWE
jgi:manganese/zinc/iron transport system substrate-binding protein